MPQCPCYTQNTGPGANTQALVPVYYTCAGQSGNAVIPLAHANCCGGATLNAQAVCDHECLDSDNPCFDNVTPTTNDNPAIEPHTVDSGDSTIKIDKPIKPIRLKESELINLIKGFITESPAGCLPHSTIAPTLPWACEKCCSWHKSGELYNTSHSQFLSSCLLLLEGSPTCPNCACVLGASYNSLGCNSDFPPHSPSGGCGTTPPKTPAYTPKTPNTQRSINEYNLSESKTTSKLKFNKQSRKKGAKTDVYNVVKGGTTIGQVKWYSRLRGYGFLPPSGDESEVTEFVKEISKTHRENNKKNKK